MKDSRKFMKTMWVILLQSRELSGTTVLITYFLLSNHWDCFLNQSKHSVVSIQDIYNIEDVPTYITKNDGFCLENAMGYGISESMGYGLEFPTYWHGSSKILWGMREYGLSGVWVIRVSTVITRRISHQKNKSTWLLSGPWTLTKATHL